MVNLQNEVKKIVDAMEPLSDTELQSIVTSNLGAVDNGLRSTVCILQAAHRGVDRLNVGIGLHYDRLFMNHGASFIDALRAEILSRTHVHVDAAVEVPSGLPPTMQTV